MKKGLYLGVMILLLAILAIYAPVANAVEKGGNDEIVAIAGPMVDKLNKAMETKNFKDYMEPYSPEMKKNLSRDNFNICADSRNKQVGKVMSKTFLNVVDYKGCKVVQWKAKVSKCPSEVYLQLSLKKINGKYYVQEHNIRSKEIK
jgi:hypothetical protein